jgi:LysM domain.
MNFKKALVSTLGTAAILGAGFFASTTSANADVRVTVKSGDTVAKIANQYNSSISAIESANSLKNVNMIYVGESLVIPSSASTTTTTHTTTPSTSQTTSANTTAATTTRAATTGTTNYSSQQNTSANTASTTANTANASSTSSASTSTSTSSSSSSEPQPSPGLPTRNLVAHTPRRTGNTLGSTN